MPAERYQEMKARILKKEDIQSQHSKISGPDLLKLLITLNEAKDEITEIVGVSPFRVELPFLDLSSSDISAIASVVSVCSEVELDLKACKLNVLSLHNLQAALDTSVKVKRLNLNANTEIGIEGVSIVGGIVTRNNVEYLSLNTCNLDTQHLLTLENSTRNAKQVQELFLNDNTDMGTEGISAVGRIVTQNDVEHLSLSNCDLTCDELSTLAESVKNAKKLQLLNLSEQRIVDEDSELIKAVGNLLQNVAVEVNLSGWEMADKHREYLQNELDELYNKNRELIIIYSDSGQTRMLFCEKPQQRRDQEQQSEVIKLGEMHAIHKSDETVLLIGSSLIWEEFDEDEGNEVISHTTWEAPNVEELRLKDDAALLSEKEFEYGFHTQETEKELGPDGGLIEVGECSLSISPGSFTETRVLKMSASMDFRSLALDEELMQVSPWISIKFGGELKIPALLRAPSWFSSSRKNVVRIYKRTVNDKSWRKLENEVKVTDGCIEFQIDHFCMFVAAVQFISQMLEPANITLSHALVHHGRNFHSVVCYAKPESLIQQKINQLRADGYTLVHQDTVIVFMKPFPDDRIPIVVKSSRPELYYFRPDQRELTFSEMKMHCKNTRSFTFVLDYRQQPRTKDVDIRYIISKEDFVYVVKVSTDDVWVAPMNEANPNDRGLTATEAQSSSVDPENEDTTAVPSSRESDTSSNDATGSRIGCNVAKDASLVAGDGGITAHFEHCNINVIAGISDGRSENSGKVWKEVGSTNGSGGNA